jgi:beta-glucosidase
MRALDGGWSYSWQGEYAPKFTQQYNTILKAIQNVYGAENVEYVAGVSYIEDGKYWQEAEAGIDEAVSRAADVDSIVLVVGENSYTEKPGDTHDLSLSQLQLKLATELIKTGKPLILVLSEGRPRIIDKIVDSLAGILLIYLPGNYGGDALADILIGNVNPSGKLSYTYPRYRNSIVNYWHKYSEEQTAQPGAYNYESDYNPLYEFGYGFSYTTFEYSDLKLSRTSFGIQENLNVSITVKNNGTVTGKEAVLVYVSDLYASVAPDMKRLRNFDKIELAPGESQV